MQADLSLFANRYRTRHAPEWDADPSEREWLTEIPCTQAKGGGHIYTYGRERLAYLGDQVCRKRALLLIPGVEIVQEGDQEFVAAFPVELLDRVARVVGAIKRKRLSPTGRAKLAEAGKSTRFAALDAKIQAAEPCNTDNRPGMGLDGVAARGGEVG